MNSEFNSVPSDNIQVAVRLRPLIESELSHGYKNILEVYENIKQIKVKGSDTAFTYNYVYDTNTNQETFYSTCIKGLLENLFKGYNLTILAYGQTGSGKTFSMGTSYDGSCNMGVIPRAIQDIFAYVNDNFLYDFTISVSFMELYQETLYDLLVERPRDQCSLELREDSKGILIPGLTEIVTSSASETMELLCKGASCRATGATNMNTHSSRSHAVFTINICMQKKEDCNSNKTAKFHLVDLAGSERSKKTGATGQTFKEGVNINKGLLALGNVIAALGDEKLQGGYISYRESNLTRLLKDSLGGNSITLMICCVSPADFNSQETMTTLKYADRVKKIKNKPVVNQDPKAAEVNRLKKLVEQLQLELIGQGGSLICQADLEQIRRELETLKMKNHELTLQLSIALTEKTSLHEHIMLMQTANEQMNEKLQNLKDEYNVTVGVLTHSFDGNCPNNLKDHMQKLHTIENLFTDINCQLSKNNDEIRKHELCVSFTNNNSRDAKLGTEFTVEQENHMKKQVEMNFELQEVTKMLAMKEDIAQKMLENNNNFVNYNSITENESKVLLLQKEKDDLLKQLKDANPSGVSSKLAEQRRIRVMELEKQIQELQKKITEQARMIKLKEKDEQKIKQLNREIQEMKQTKVKLIKTMKLEADRFNTWKLQREREFNKLREQDRKLQNQIVKMETMHNRQQNVLRRKVEEAAAINKRLKDSLALRKNIQDQKSVGKVERIVPWVEHELDIAVNIIDAETTIRNLLDERATLTQQLAQFNTNSSMYSSEDVKQLEDEIDIRSIQIRDLQQKILDSDQDNKSKTRWDNIQTMGDAKFVLKTLFEHVVVSRLKNNACEEKLSELSNAQTEVNRMKDELVNLVKTLKMEHEENLSMQNKEYEEKICLLLRQLRGVNVEGVEKQLNQQCAIQQERIDQLEAEKEHLEKTNIVQEKELLETQNRLKKINEQLSPKRKEENVSMLNKPIPWERKFVLDNDSDLNSTAEDPNDPDWHKTPLAKRLKKFKNTSQTSNMEQSRLTFKRSSNGTCACKGNCTKRSCSCKKFSRECGVSCKCSKDICLNKNGEKENLTVPTTLFNSSDQNSEESFKKSRILEELENSN